MTFDFLFRLDRWSNQLFAKFVAKNSKKLILRPHVPVAEGRCPKKQSVKIAKDGKKAGYELLFKSSALQI